MSTVSPSTIPVGASPLGNALSDMLTAQQIVPGDDPSYALCKIIMAYHPLGAKMSDSPIAMAQSQVREIVVKGPEERLKEAFNDEWLAVGADRHIFNTGRLSRAYGVSSLALMVEGVPSDRPVDYKALADAKISFNVFDPLNTAGSLVLNQNPNDMDFQKTVGITVQGQAYHRSRTAILMNEEPLYINYTRSAYGYVGRSVYQRALFMLKSYIQTLITDDMVSLKAGVLIAKTKSPGSVVDQFMAGVAGQKRAIVQEAATGNVISVGHEDSIESLDLQNLDGAYGMARKNILENIATAADMPAFILNQETFAEGFGEGSEDAKKVAAFVARIRVWMAPLYEFFDKIVMYRAWNPEFYKTLQKDFPEQFRGVTYTQAFYGWRNSFRATWPNLLEEPDSEKVKVADVKLKAIIAMVEVLGPMLDPENKATMIQWAQDNFNEQKILFGSPLQLDIEALKDYEPPVAAAGAGGEPSEPKPFASTDAARRAVDALTASVSRLPDLQARRAAMRDKVIA